MRDNDNKVILRFYRLSKEVEIPKFATAGSAAFDIRAFFDGSAILAYDTENIEAYALPCSTNLFLMPGYRYRIPTGLILDIPEGYRLDVNIRGGTALKKGLILSNSTGIIDWDYTQELFVCLTNTSKSMVKIEHGERLAQVMLEKVEPLVLEELDIPPLQKTERNGGFNSTGIK